MHGPNDKNDDYSHIQPLSESVNESHRSFKLVIVVVAAPAAAAGADVDDSDDSNTITHINRVYFV